MSSVRRRRDGTAHHGESDPASISGEAPDSAGAVALARADPASDGFAPSGWFPGDVPSQLLEREAEMALGLEILEARERVRVRLASAPELVAWSASRRHAAAASGFRETLAVAAIDLARATARSWARPAKPAGRENRPHPGSFGFASAAALQAFADDVEAGLRVYRALRDRLIEANLRLVIALARRHRRGDVPTLDLIQDGIFGLVRAIEKWDPRRDVRFGTYAVHWVRQYIGLAGESHAALIRTPSHWRRHRRALHAAAQKLEGSGRPMRRADVAAEAGIKLENAERVQVRHYCVSLDEPAGDDDNRTLEEILPSPAVAADESFAVASLPMRIESVLAKLPEREALVLRLRFGTGANVALTLDEVAVRFGISKERVRQLEAKALRRLAPICEKEGLRGYVP